ncbi:hypothetical protein ACFXGA_21745 [Actinosynnema sp. NPDC059335]|uniref:hypothetical protein n=1 Tax=Actinosynnema sp. NPDC059335 TaxID=3346804 RepID=UPI00367009DC
MAAVHDESSYLAALAAVTRSLAEGRPEPEAVEDAPVPGREANPGPDGTTGR